MDALRIVLVRLAVEPSWVQRPMPVADWSHRAASDTLERVPHDRVQGQVTRPTRAPLAHPSARHLSRASAG